MFGRLSNETNGGSVDLCRNAIILQIQMAELQVGIQVHLFHSLLDIVGTHINSKILHVGSNAFTHSGLEHIGSKGYKASPTPLFLCRGR